MIMGLTKAFEEAVTSGDVRSIRIMMKDSLLIDPSFKEFEEMEEAASSLQGLYEAHDGRDFQDQSTWDDNYMNKLMVQVVNNFSKQRVNHLKEVVKYLGPAAKESIYQQQKYQDQIESTCPMKKTGSSPTSRWNSHKTESIYQQQKYQDQKEGNYRESKMMKGSIGGAAIGGATSGGIGAALARYTLEAGGTAASSVAGGAAVGAVIGGVVVLCIVLGIANHYNKNKED